MKDPVQVFQDKLIPNYSEKYWKTEAALIIPQ
jgi:hypothetical protein